MATSSTFFDREYILPYRDHKLGLWEFNLDMDQKVSNLSFYALNLSPPRFSFTLNWFSLNLAQMYNKAFHYILL